MAWNEILALATAVMALASPFATVAVMRARIDRVEKDFEKLDRDKATRESVEGLHVLLRQLREDMDRRFDRLERLLIGREDTRP